MLILIQIILNTLEKIVLKKFSFNLGNTTMVHCKGSFTETTSRLIGYIFFNISSNQCHSSFLSCTLDSDEFYFDTVKVRSANPCPFIYISKFYFS